jgi:hypothetical protein
MSLAHLKPKSLEAENQDMTLAPPFQQACWAVVSFLFQDAVWCDWIYREFDGTRVPRPLLGRPSRHGTPYPDRISVSPDPADPQQLESYADALKLAQHLVIIVSPGSAHAEMMQEHMRIFRASGGEERIIALVVKGDPASPSAEPGNDSDRDWLPKWLEWRFQKNAFDPAPPSEPMVIDARLGVASLSEVRAKLCAALLEVPVAQLPELGVVIRTSPSERALQAAPSAILSMPAPAPIPTPMPMPTPLPTLATIATPKMQPPPKHSHWPVVLCAVAAVVALGCLAFWPEKIPAPASPKTAKTPLAARNETPEAATQMRELSPVVAVVPVSERVSAGQPTSSSANPASESSTTAPQVHVPEPSAITLPATPTLPLAAIAVPATAPTPPNGAATPSGTSGVAPASGAGAVPVSPDVEPGTPVVMTPEAEAAERKRYELASRRDRLVRLAEMKINAGETEEAIAAFQQAVETANELVNRTDGGHDEVIELALLYRRFGNFAAGANSAAEGRQYFDRGRKALQALRAKGKLPREAIRILNDLEAGAKASLRE